MGTLNIDVVVATIAAIATIVAAGISSFSAFKAHSHSLKLQEEVEKAVVLNSQLTHIRNSRFDYEFEIYKELSEASFQAVHALNNYFNSICGGIISDKKMHKYNEMEEHCKAFREKLYRAGAFIPEAQFIEFETLLNLCGDVQATFYNEMYMYSDKEKEVAIKKIENNIEKLHESQKNLMATMREYLTKYMPTAQDSGKKNDSKQS